nr:ApaLI family restriction endonuclease [Helicobacter felis]
MERRDTDGDHITKEYTRVKAIKQRGYKPIRVMFYYPQRAQAKKIQETLETLYLGVGGKYYYGDLAWDYIQDYTGINLMEILEKIATTRR